MQVFLSNTVRLARLSGPTSLYICKSTCNMRRKFFTPMLPEESTISCRSSLAERVHFRVLESTTFTPGKEHARVMRPMRVHFRVLESTTFTPGKEQARVMRVYFRVLESTTFTPGKETERAKRVHFQVVFSLFNSPKSRMNC